MVDSHCGGVVVNRSVFHGDDGGCCGNGAIFVHVDMCQLLDVADKEFHWRHQREVGTHGIKCILHAQCFHRIHQSQIAVRLESRHGELDTRPLHGFLDVLPAFGSERFPHVRQVWHEKSHTEFHVVAIVELHGLVALCLRVHHHFLLVHHRDAHGFVAIVVESVVVGHFLLKGRRPSSLEVNRVDENHPEHIVWQHLDGRNGSVCGFVHPIVDDVHRFLFRQIECLQIGIVIFCVHIIER